MRTRIIVSGFGGQGVMVAGRLLCTCGIHQKKHVSLIPSYGVEMRGGTSNCHVIISDWPIGSPIITAPDIVVAMNAPSFDKFAPRVAEGGLILANASLINADPVNGREVISLPVNQLAETCGSTLSANMVIMGALIAHTGLFEEKDCLGFIPEIFGERKKKLWEMNQKAFHAGFNYKP